MLITDRYKNIGSAHPGGMASVYPCHDSILDRKVAIKVMPGSANHRRARDEISALLKMRSKHVVQIYDILRDNSDDLAIVQEYISGRDLFEAETAPKDANEYLKLIWQISSGIADIHSLDVIHRDIKPNNMKIDSEGLVKIFDFGLSRNEGPQAATVGFVGTRGFAAPELYAHNSTFTKAVDTYAFGATALFIGLRTLPQEILQQPPTLPASNPFSFPGLKLSSEVTSALGSCLNPNPSKRPTMSKVRDVLAKHLLQDKHKALVVFKGKASNLDHSNRSVALRLPPIGEVEISYNGFDFSVTNISGNVYINNRKATIGHILPGACVVTLGAPVHKSDRRHITFDISHPEIVL